MVSFLSNIQWCFIPQVLGRNVIDVCRDKLAYVQMSIQSSIVKWCIANVTFRIFLIHIFEYELTNVRKPISCSPVKRCLTYIGAGMMTTDLPLVTMYAPAWRCIPARTSHSTIISILCTSSSFGPHHWTP